MEPEEVLVIESIANSIDANASTIKITLHDNIFSVEDNGVGMTKEEFEEYFAALAFSGKKKGQGIGWAGIGAKLYLAVPDSEIYVESRKRMDMEGFACKIWPVGSDIEWDYVDGEPKVLKHAGTYYEVKLRQGHGLTTNKIEEIVKRRYNGILLGLYGTKRILVNEQEIKPFYPQLDKEPWIEKIRSKYGKIEFRLYLLKTPLSEPYGIDFIVYGKSIHKDIDKFLPYEIAIKPEYKNKIMVLVIADVLSKILTTNKEDINPSTNPRLWASIRNRVIRALENSLLSMNLAEERKIPVFDEKKFIIKEVEDVLSKVFQNPFLRGYNPFLSSLKTSTAIPSSYGETGVEPVDGMQKIPGTIGGADKGERMPTEGPEPGTGWVGSESDKIRGEIVTRERRTGLKVAFDDLKDPNLESLIKGDTLIINTSAPQFLLAEKRNQTLPHTIRCVFMSLIEYKEGGQEIPLSKAFDKIRLFYREWAKAELGIT
jgi:hypothetical protein